MIICGYNIFPTPCLLLQIVFAMHVPKDVTNFTCARHMEYTGIDDYNLATEVMNV